MQTIRLIITLLILCSLVCYANCTISVLRKELFRPGTFSLQRHALITKEDAKSIVLFPSDNSHVKFDLSIDSVDKSSSKSKHVLHIAFFHSDDLPDVGKLVPRTNVRGRGTNTLQLCEKGKLYFSGTTDRIMYEQVAVDSNDARVPFHHFFDITKSGVYYLLIANCDTHNANDEALIVSGRIEYKNPYGQLDAEQFGFLPFYGICGIIYVIMGSVWAIWHLSYCWMKASDEAQNSSNGVVLPVQIWTSIVFVLSLIECISWYIHYYEWNNSLRSSTNSRNFLYSFALLATVIRRTMCRVLVILVAMGYGGWVRTHLSTNRRAILVSFSCLYFAASCLAEIVKLLSFRYHIINSFLAMMLELPVSLLDAVCVVWVWMELKTLITQLRHRRQITKLRMYRSFKWLLVIYILVGAFWSVYEMWLVIFEPSIAQQQALSQAKDEQAINNVKKIDFARLMRDKRWATNWTMVAFWNILYMIVLMCLMALWRPQNNDQRFVVVPGLTLGEDWVPTDSTSATDIERVSLVPRTTESEEKVAVKPKKSKKQKFSIDEDLEQELEDFGDENDSDIEQKED